MTRHAQWAIELNLSRQRLEASRSKLKTMRQRLTGSSGLIVKEMRVFIDETVGSTAVAGFGIAERWSNFLAELRRLHDLEADLETVKTLSAKIANAGAPSWAARLTAEPIEGIEDALTPSDWREVWSWAQQERFLWSIDGRKQLTALAKERIAAAEQLERVFRDVVRDRTFLALNQSLADRVRAALVMFVAAIRQIGAGTGVRASGLIPTFGTLGFGRR